jgi:hypothetical protein
MTAGQRHFYQAGARLVRSGGWTNARIVDWCKQQGLARIDRAYVLRGASDERRTNPTGRPGVRLGGKMTNEKQV